MKVSTEKLPASKVRITVEIDDERLEKSMDQAFRRVANRARVPGFRPGKAPRQMVERYVGRSTILTEALDRLVPEVYQEVVEKEAIDVIAQPELSITQIEPVIFEATVAVRPTVDLKDYRSVRVPLELTEVTTEQVDQALEALRERYSSIEPADRPAKEGDIVTADVEASIEGQADVFRDEDAQFRLTEQLERGLPGLVQTIVGMSRGEEREVDHQIPDDHEDEDARGKAAHYRVKLEEVKEVLLPEVNDEFASNVGEGFESLLALRGRLREDLEAEAKREAEEKQRVAVIDAILEQAELEYPEVLVEREVDHIIQDSGGNDEAAFREQLLRAGKTEQEYREELRPIAEERVRRSLVLLEVADREGIEVSDQEIDEEIERIAGQSPQAEQIRAIFNSEGARDSIRRTLHTRKTYDRLSAIALGEAPEPAGAAEPAGEEEAPGEAASE